LITFDNRTFKTQLKSTSYYNMYVQSMLIVKQNKIEQNINWVDAKYEYKIHINTQGR